MNRSLGCFFGTVVGDALGAPVEFKDRDSFPLVTDMQAGGAFNLQAGEWTDDTSTMLCLATSIIEHNTINELDFLGKLLKWYSQGEYSSNGRCFDIGGTVKSALINLKKNGYKYVPASDALGMGNNSIVRMAPVVIRWQHDEETCRAMARKQSISTHGSPRATDMADRTAGCLFALLKGRDRHDVFPEKYPQPELTRAQVSSAGDCISTLAAAQWCMRNSSSFEEAVLLAVNLGDDADSVGALVGAFAGAAYGYGAIPERWINQLAKLDDLQLVASQLLLASVND